MSPSGRRPARSLARALGLIGALLAGCDAARAPATQGAAADPAPGGGGHLSAAARSADVRPASPPAAAPPAAVAPRADPPGPLGCRVMSSTGPAQRGSGAAVRAGDRFTGSDWLELAQGASLHLKHGDSGREWTLRGPARVLPCVDGREELIVAEGKLRMELGAGARPGAQVLIGTPFGSLRYADASADLDITRDALRLSVSAGETWLRPAGAPGPETHTTRAQSARRGQRQRLTAATAVEACEKAARQSEALAKSLLEPSPSALGKLAADHVRARELARASCAAAMAAVLQQNTGAQREARLSALAASREIWRRIPRAG